MATKDQSWDPKNGRHRVSIKIICIHNKKILLWHEKVRTKRNLIWWWVDKWESIQTTIEREFEEEVWYKLANIQHKKPLLREVTIEQFEKTKKFDAVCNIFYTINFSEAFIIKNNDLYHDIWRYNKKEIEKMDISIHSNKNLLIDILTNN
jgi:8-oxo-dGTP pyrophosphatase MutT (NUDIX family)